MSAGHHGAPSVKSLVLVPALITLAITLLRLAGELLQWSPEFFSRQGGGGRAIVGIVWLVPILGIYFAWRLARAEPSPGAGRVVAHALLALALVAASGIVVGRVLKLSQNAVFLTLFVAGVAGGWIAHRGWPALGRTLLAYGLAARVPVILVMLAAILANWGTHYDVAPPGFPEMAPLPKWFLIGVLPQLFLWVPFTMLVGALFGGLALLIVGRGRQPASA